jgi:hypothetical protein
MMNRDELIDMTGHAALRTVAPVVRMTFPRQPALFLFIDVFLINAVIWWPSA